MHVMIVTRMKHQNEYRDLSQLKSPVDLNMENHSVDRGVSIDPDTEKTAEKTELGMIHLR
jgi:hypothetical protein